MWHPNSLLLRRSWGFHLILRRRAGGRVCDQMVVQPLPTASVCDLSFTCCVEVAQLISGFFPEGIVPCVVVDLVCP